MTGRAAAVTTGMDGAPRGAVSAGGSVKIAQELLQTELLRMPSGYNHGCRQDLRFARPKEKSMCELASKKCVPCQDGAAPLKGDDITTMLRQLSGWEVINEHHLFKEFKFPNFATALAFVNRVGEVAETEGHHPDILLSWGKAAIQIYTHKIDGLSESDFILAAKIDELPLR